MEELKVDQIKSLLDCGYCQNSEFKQNLALFLT